MSHIWRNVREKKAPKSGAVTGEDGEENIHYSQILQKEELLQMVQHVCIEATERKPLSKLSQ